MSRWVKPVGWMTTNAKAANKIMSGLDGLGWPNPKDEPKPKKTMNSQLKIKLAPTPETDAELNYRYYGFFCTMGGLPAEAVGADFARELERERDQFSKTLGEVRAILCDALPNENQLTSFMAATLVRERDKLLKELNVLSYWRDISECDCHNPLPNGGCLRCDLDKTFNSNQQPK